LLYSIFSFLVIAGSAQEYLSGFGKSLHGEELQYHSPQPDANKSLLVRSENTQNFIEWETEAMPSDYNPAAVTFLMLAGFDVNPQDPHSWDISVNGKKCFRISSPLDTLQKSISWTGPEEYRMNFDATLVDRYGDFMGYLYLTMPAKHLPPGKPVKIKVEGETAGSRTWFMVFKYLAHNRVNLAAENTIRQGNNQLLRVDVVYYGEPDTATIGVDGATIRKTISRGYNVHYMEVPLLQAERSFHVMVSTSSGLLTDTTFLIRPVTHRTIYLLHHSHNDIGYTHVQDEVERMQWANLEKAVVLATASQDLPSGERFRWNVEVMWAVDSYLRKATEEQKAKLKDAVRKGWIELDAFYSNTLTGLCTPRELNELTESARRIARECGVDLTAAMVSDIPGWSWGIVNVLAKSGVRYLSLGNNSGHRVGSMNATWGDRPFYWISASGEDSVLAWIHARGYSFFHTGLGFEKIKNRVSEEKIFEYVNQMAEENYPYEIAVLRYNIGSDNGPADDFFSEAVQSWNERYITPKLVISTVSEAFGAFEKEYGDQLPSYKGDLTGYWEDGAASSALETAINRDNAARLEQAEALWAMIHPESFPREEFREAWRQVLLYDEHTWGSWNSISEPFSPFTQQQWAIKRSFALKADTLSRRLMNNVLALRKTETPDAIEVINTSSWPRTDLVVFPGEFPAEAGYIREQEGNVFPVQMLTSGEHVFLAREVPAFGSKIFYPETGASRSEKGAETGKILIGNSLYEIQFDSLTGAIASIFDKSLKKELVQGDGSGGLNAYYYVEGRDPSHPLPVDLIKIKVKESGPVVNSLIVAAQAPGCLYLTREVRLVDGLKRIDIINMIDKSNVYEPEGVHMSFPFQVPDGILRYGLAYGACRAETDQLPGANRNFITASNWVDVSNGQFGATVTLPGTPLIEAGSITMDEIVYGWVDQLEPTQTFYSYIMNNYWETNYKASQEGPFTFAYSIHPHEVLNLTEAEKAGLSSRQPLIAVPASTDGLPLAQLLDWNNPNVISIDLKPSPDGKGICVTLINPGDKPERIQMNYKGIYLSNLDGDRLKKAEKVMTLKCFESMYLLIYK
jgi:hypothetical protein